MARDLRKWLAATGAKTLYIEPGSPWENGYCESFNSKLRDEFLNGEIFYSLREVQVLAERWRVHYNTIRPHSSLGYRSPAPEDVAPRAESRVWRSGKQSTLPHFPTPSTAVKYLQNSLRYTNNPTGTKDRAGPTVRDRSPGLSGVWIGVHQEVQLRMRKTELDVACQAVHGSEMLDFSDVARIVSEIMGQPVEREVESDEAYRAMPCEAGYA